MLVLRKRTNAKHIHVYNSYSKGFFPFKKLLRTYSEWINKPLILTYKERQSVYQMFSDTKAIPDLSSQKIFNEADLIHMHWTAGFLRYEHLFSKNCKKPVVMTATSKVIHIMQSH